jgi:hypothetical protein
MVLKEKYFSKITKFLKDIVVINIIYFYMNVREVCFKIISFNLKDYL